MKKEDKRGQFYIIAAVIIVSVIIGLMSTSYVRTSNEKVKIYDLGNELKLESAKVIDYGINTNMDQSTISQSWAANFSAYSQSSLLEGEKVVFVYGTPDDIRYAEFIKADLGTIGLGESGVSNEAQQFKAYSCAGSGDGSKTLCTISSGRDRVELDIPKEDGTYSNYTFELKQGQNFYIVLKTETKSISQ
jgi:hypothetical protein